MLTELLVLCVAVIFIALKYLKESKNHKNLPPGPWGLPIVGHLPFFGENPSKKFLQWKKIYGPIFSVKFGSFPAVVINDAKLIKEAFNLDALSGRPLLTNFGLWADFKGILFADGPRHKEQRKFAQKSFKEIGLAKSEFEFRSQNEISKFLSDLKNKCRSMTTKVPMEIRYFFRYPVINAIWVAIIGRRFDEDDPTLFEFFDIMDRNADTNSTVLAQMSLFFPWVAKSLHFLGINKAMEDGRIIYNYFGNQIDQCRKDHVAGHPKHFTHAYFDEVDEATDPNSSFYKGKEQRISTGDIFFGASDTTSVTLDWLLIYMARAPLIQQKLQAEIDSILGTKEHSRASSLSDVTSMPYTAAVVHELLRISSVSPIGLMQRALEDVQFHGYVIPKDTMVIGNFYGVNHDPGTWEDADNFNPERFLDARTGKLKKIPEELMPFGFGKRKCIGEGFARDQIFLMCTSFFQQFSVSCTSKVPSLQGKFGVVTGPLPFELFVTER